MDSSVSPKDEIWFLRVCHYISNAVYNTIYTSTKNSRKRIFEGRTSWWLRPRFKRNAAFYSLQTSSFWEITRTELHQPPTLTTFLWFFESWLQNVVNILSPFAKANVQIMNKEAFWITYENNAATYKTTAKYCVLWHYTALDNRLQRRPNDNVYKYVTSLLSLLKRKN